MNNLQAQDWPELSRYQRANAALEAPKSDENRVVFMGNSITEGWAHAFPEFFSKNKYVNRGIGGQTTPQMLIRFRQDVVDVQASVVVILAGTNDIAGNTGPSTLKMIADNIFSMAEIANANGICVVISSVLPVYDYSWKPGLEPALKIVALNAMLKAYCQEQGHVYLDYFSEMANDKNGLIKEYGYDGVHPNEAGYAVMMPLAQQAIDQALQKI